METLIGFLLIAPLFLILWGLAGVVVAVAVAVFRGRF
jgi:hypothetical protein